MNQTKLQAACKEFIREFPHFLGCINFNESALTARALRFFNEVPGKIETALNELEEEPKE